MLTLVILNIVLYQLLWYPRRTLDMNSFYFSSYTHFKGSWLLKTLKYFVVLLLKPFLVNDKGNNISFMCFANSMSILLLFDVPSPLESLLLSINAASIFHYFVIIIPSEKLKLSAARDVATIVNNLAERDELFYKLLKYNPSLLGNSSCEKNKLESLLLERMDTCLDLDLNSRTFIDLASPKTVSRLNDGVTLKQFWEHMIDLDRDFLARMFKEDLSLFPDLSLKLGDFYQRYSAFTGINEGRINSLAVYYLIDRKHLIATFYNTAANYSCHPSQNFKNYKVSH